VDLGLRRTGARRCACRDNEAAGDCGAAQVASPHVFAAHVSVEISNGKGGLLDLSITVPVKTAASHEPSQFLGILGENGTLLGILDDNGMLFKILDENGTL
jgi:hypothetical protein